MKNLLSTLLYLLPGGTASKMPHKRAKRSVREKAKAERKLDLAPSQSTFTSNDIPKSMARVLNSEAIQNAWKEKKRTLEQDGNGGGEGGKRKRRKIADTTAGGTSKNNDIRIKPGESLRHFKRRVEDDMRPIIRSAMKNTTSISRQKAKQSQKDVEQLSNQRHKPKGGRGQDVSDSESGEDTAPGGSQRRKDNPKTKERQAKGKRSPSPDFVRLSSSAPKRLNDIVQAPPELKSAAPRLSRLVQKRSQSQKQTKLGNDGLSRGDDNDGDSVIGLQQKRMMELEREKAINRYRALKEAKLKEQ